MIMWMNKIGFGKYRRNPRSRKILLGGMNRHRKACADPKGSADTRSGTTAIDGLSWYSAAMISETALFFFPPFAIESFQQFHID